MKYLHDIEYGKAFVCGMIGPGFEPHQCLLTGMTKRSAGVAPEVNFWECLIHTPPPSASEAANAGFEAEDTSR